MPDRSWFTIQNAAKSRRASVYLFDDIGVWGVRAADFISEINALDVDALDVVINSGGGDVYQAFAIYNGLKRHKATIGVTVDGVAASAASVVAMAADPGKLTMSKPGQMMIHDPYAVTIGDVEAHEKSIEQLTAARGDIADVYASRSGIDVDEIRDLMKAETWYTAEGAVDAGLADEVAEAAPNAYTTGRIYNLNSRYHNVPEWAVQDPEPVAPSAPPIKIAANIRRSATVAYLEHHDEAGNVDAARLDLALARAHNTAIPVDDREAVIRHLKAHRS